MSDRRHSHCKRGHDLRLPDARRESDGRCARCYDARKRQYVVCLSCGIGKYRDSRPICLSCSAAIRAEKAAKIADAIEKLHERQRIADDLKASLEDAVRLESAPRWVQMGDAATKRWWLGYDGEGESSPLFQKFGDGDELDDEEDGGREEPDRRGLAANS